MFITPEIAKAHLRIVGDDEAVDLALKSAAAEQAAVSYLDRAVFVDQAALDVAVAAVPAALVAAKAAFLAADAAALVIADAELAAIESAHALDVYTRARFAADRIRRGLVIDPLVQSAMLLMLGELWERRSETENGTVTTLPYGARCMLDAYRHFGA
jgi:hypothetical protein